MSGGGGTSSAAMRVPVLSSGNLSLFGGAITARIPNERASGYIDVSNIRPVPDNQEVFMEIAGSGSSIMVDIVEYQRDQQLSEVCSYLFDDMAELNGSPKSSRVVVRTSCIQGSSWCGERCPEGCEGIGVLHGTTDKVHSWLAVIRLPAQGSDVAIWIYCPQETATTFDGEGLLRSIVDTFWIRNVALFG